MNGTTPGPRRLSSFWKIVSLILVNLVVLLGLLYGFEFYLSRTSPLRNLPPEPVEERNRLGFREREFAVPKPAEVCRIMVLGDSFTWGKGVWVEERYTNLTETYLNEAYPDRTFEVLSFGFPGSPTTRERDALRDYKDETDPDLIVVGFVINDPQTKSQDYSVEREQFENRIGEPLDALLEEVEDLRLEYTAELARRAIDSFIVKAGLVPSWEEALQRTYEPDSFEWQQFEQALRDIKTMSDELGLPQPILTILNQGAYTDRPTDYGHPDEALQILLNWYHQAEQTGAQLGFNPINHEPEFAAQMSDEIMAVTLLDAHPSPKMHSIYAQKLSEQIKNYVDSGQLCPPASASDLAPTGRPVEKF
jgi:lysophospholipase L1-like esterase